MGLVKIYHPIYKPIIKELIIKKNRPIACNRSEKRKK